MAFTEFLLLHRSNLFSGKRVCSLKLIFVLKQCNFFTFAQRHESNGPIYTPLCASAASALTAIRLCLSKQKVC